MALDRDQADTSIVLAPGNYSVTGTPSIHQRRVVIRGATGNADDVTIDLSSAAGLINVNASDVIIAHLTFGGADAEGIVVQPDDASGPIENIALYDLRMADMLKNVRVIGRDGSFADDGIVGCSRFTMSDAFRSVLGARCNSIAAIQLRGAARWDIHSNYIEGFWCPPSGLGFAIHAHEGTSELTIRENRMHQNGVGIRLGIYETARPNSRIHAATACSETVSGYIANVGGLICSNTISNPATTGFSDSGIMIWNSCDTVAIHNTIYSVPPVMAAIESRYANSVGIQLINNLVNRPLVLRNGAPPTNQLGNITDAQDTWLVDPPGGDLHLLAAATDAIGNGADHALPCRRDVDHAPRVAPIDIGADEFATP